MKDVFYLDLHRDELLGWEETKSKSAIERMVKSVKKGDKFPAVPVRKVADNKYVLCTDVKINRIRSDGGHHRAIAHYLAGKKLLCRLVEEDYDYCCADFFPIRDIFLSEKALY